MLERRRFLQALAASVVAAGVPLPVGFPKPETHPDMFSITNGPLDLADWSTFRIRGADGDMGVYRVIMRIGNGGEVEPV